MEKFYDDKMIYLSKNITNFYKFNKENLNEN